jgi:hypothetical protein
MSGRYLPWVLVASLAAVALHAMQTSVLTIPPAPLVATPEMPSVPVLPASFGS